VIVDYIEGHRSRFGVVPICTVLSRHGMSIAPSTYYAVRARRRGDPSRRVSERDLLDAYLANAVLDCWRANRSVYGIRKMWHALRRGGHQVGRDQTARLMSVVAAQGACRGVRRTRTTVPQPGAPRHPDLVRRGWDVPARPDALWVADFTYCWTLAGFVYVAFCTDVYSRRILGWRVSTSKTTPLVTSVLDQAVFTRRRGDEQHGVQFIPTGLIHHSDAGSQYTSLAFTEALREAGIAGSIGTVGDALDNALMESTIGLFKTELITRQRSWTGRNEVERETAAWVRWFNTERLHSALGHVPPAEFEQRYRESARDHTVHTDPGASTEVA
jgi:putative transposase